MLTGEYQTNKDFDINNLFLNLTFHNTTETFEYKEAILDHPSNYQLVVTKFLSKVNFPFIKLIESKKDTELKFWSSGSNTILLDYYVQVGFHYSTSRFQNKFTSNWINQNLFMKSYEKQEPFKYYFRGVEVKK